MNKIQKFKHNVIFMFFLYFLIYLIVIPEIALSYEDNAIILMILSLFFCLMYIYLNKDEFEDLLSKLMSVCKDSINIGFISVLIILINISCTTIKEYLGFQDNYNQMNLMEVYHNAPILYSIYIVVITPIVEELVFKSVLYKKSKNTNKKMTLFLTCILFAILHLLNEIGHFKVYILIDFINYFLFSFITLNKYKKENNILYPIFIHMLCNFVALYL